MRLGFALHGGLCAAQPPHITNYSVFYPCSMTVITYSPGLFFLLNLLVLFFLCFLYNEELVRFCFCLCNKLPLERVGRAVPKEPEWWNYVKAAPQLSGVLLEQWNQMVYICLFWTQGKVCAELSPATHFTLGFLPASPSMAFKITPNVQLSKLSGPQALSRFPHHRDKMPPLKNRPDARWAPCGC